MTNSNFAATSILSARGGLIAEIILSGKELTGLEYAVAHAHDGCVVQRAYALLWLDDGDSAADVATRLRELAIELQLDRSVSGSRRSRDHLPIV